MESGDKITSPEAGSASIQSSWMKNNNYNGLRSKKKKCDQSLGFFFYVEGAIHANSGCQGVPVGPTHPSHTPKVLWCSLAPSPGTWPLLIQNLSLFFWIFR